MKVKFACKVGKTILVSVLSNEFLDISHRIPTFETLKQHLFSNDFHEFIQIRKFQNCCLFVGLSVVVH